jgi:hypothetical protein
MLIPLSKTRFLMAKAKLSCITLILLDFIGKTTTCCVTKS